MKISKTIAIVGASSDRRKFGNKAVRAFKAGGWTVYPINPREDEIEGLKCYQSILDTPDPVERISMYVPPQTGMSMLEDIASKNPEEVFFNPGTANVEILARAEDLGINVIQACSIVDISMSPDQFPDQ